MRDYGRMPSRPSVRPVTRVGIEPTTLGLKGVRALATHRRAQSETPLCRGESRLTLTSEARPNTVPIPSGFRRGHLTLVRAAQTPSGLPEPSGPTPPEAA
jgi:hypothetical protein